MAEIHLSKAAANRQQREDYTPPPFERVQDFHTNADTDADTNALHHSLGAGTSQASPGDHDHLGGNSNPLFQGKTISGTRGSTAYYNSLEALLVSLGASNAATG